MDDYKKLIQEVCEDNLYSVEYEDGKYYITRKAIWDLDIEHAPTLTFKRLSEACPKLKEDFMFSTEYEAWERCLLLVIDMLTYV